MKKLFDLNLSLYNEKIDEVFDYRNLNDLILDIKHFYKQGYKIKVNVEEVEE